MAKQQTPVEALAALLAKSGRDFLCLSKLPDSAVRVRFLGRFQDRAVVWDATVHALGRHAEEQNGATVRIPASRSFIDIAPASDEVFQLTVGLNLEFIDEPAIKKTIIMVRNYKRLRVGRMEWAPRIADD